MAKPERLGKVETVVVWQVGCGGWSGQGIAIVQPPHQIAVSAARRTERRMLGHTGLAANRAKGASRTG